MLNFHANKIIRLSIFACGLKADIAMFTVKLSGVFDEELYPRDSIVKRLDL